MAGAENAQLAAWNVESKEIKDSGSPSALISRFPIKIRIISDYLLTHRRNRLRSHRVAPALPHRGIGPD